MIYRLTERIVRQIYAVFHRRQHLSKISSFVSSVATWVAGDRSFASSPRDVRIYQGESEDALENIKIGQFMIEGLSKAPAGNPVVLDLALDRDGILHVTATEKDTGLERRISIDQAVARYSAAELRRARDRIGTLFGQDDTDPPLGEDVVGSGHTAVAALLAKASARLDTIGEEDRLEMIDLMEMIRDAEAAGDTAALDQARTQLGDLLFYLDT